MHLLFLVKLVRFIVADFIFFVNHDSVHLRLQEVDKVCGRIVLPDFYAGNLIQLLLANRWMRTSRSTAGLLLLFDVLPLK